MQLALSFTTLLASILVLLSTTDVQAAPHVKRTKSITLQLTRIHQNRGDVHPQVLLQQHINRSQRRLARMKGVTPPSKREFQENIDKRLFIPKGGRPNFGNVKRFNRIGTGAQVNSLIEADDEEVGGVFDEVDVDVVEEVDVDEEDDEEDDDDEPVIAALRHNHSQAAIRKGRKGKNNGAGKTGGGSAASASNLTPAIAPSAANSLGLDIEARDVGYIATIQMGTPSRNFNLLMDSGSADLWVGSETCQSEGGGDCGNHNFLGPQSSSSFTNTNKAFEVTYGTGHVTGDIVTDDITVAGLALKGHTFGVANTESTDFSANSVPFDGLMGLAQSTLSNQRTLTPVESLAKAGLITDAITSYKISRLSDGLNDGEITFGALDTSKFDASTLTTFNNVASGAALGFWEGAMDAITVDGKDVGLTGRTAILDTGTTLIVAPPKDAAALHAQIPGAQSDGQGGFVIPCDTTASVALSFAGTAFAIDPQDLIFAAADNTGTNCVSGISSGQIVDATTWLVGDVFLKNAYFSTDVTKNQISLAKLT